MRTITAMDLRRKMGEWLDRASAGERIVIERDHRPMAVLVPYEDGTRLDQPDEEMIRRREAAFDRLEAFAKRMAIAHPEGPDDLDSAAAIRWERDHGHREL
ncbi:MAG: type II toxin-antitoxin system Phd/YefM family antitoxin [Planctomycetaceae bacterium]